MDKGRIGGRKGWAKNGLERTGRKKDGLDKGRFGQRKVCAKERSGIGRVAKRKGWRREGLGQGGVV